MPSRVRNFFGNVVDHILPGNNYNPNTGQYSNIPSGIVGAGLRIGAGLIGGPVVGAVTGRLMNRYLTNHQGPGSYGLTSGGPLDGSIPLSPYTGGMVNIGGPQVGPQGNGLDGTIPMQQPTFHMHDIGPPQIGGGGGPSQTTNGFTSAFRGGGEVYDPAEFIRSLRTKGGNATQ